MISWIAKFTHMDKYAKTGLLYKYLNYLYRYHVEGCNTEPWIREGVLDEVFDSEMYPMLSLTQLLHNTKEVPKDRPSTFVLRGSKGDGRVFYFRKMISCCIEHIPPYVTWEDVRSNNHMFRLPIYVTAEAIQQWNVDAYETANNAVQSLLYTCIMQQANLEEKIAQSFVREIVDELLQRQMIAIFFEQGFCKANIVAVKIIDMLNQMENRPLAVFVEDSDFKPSDPTQQHCIDIGPVKVYQIASFLSVTLNESEEEWNSKLKNRPELIRILNKPERLLMYVKFVQTPNPTQNTDIALNNIYDAFIQHEIGTAVQYARACNRIVKDEFLRNWLQDYSEKPTSDENYDLFQKTDMFNEDGTFRFEGCKYYLIAAKYKLKPNPSHPAIRKSIQSVLKTEHPMETIGFFSCFFKKNTQLFKTFFNLLITELKSQDQKDKKLSDTALLAEVICASDAFSIVGDSYFKWATNKLDVHTYDDAILDEIVRLSDIYGSDQIAKKLMVQFNDSKASKRKQRRIVYYFSYAKQGIPSALLDCFKVLDGQDPDSRHLKYHIMDAIIDNYHVLDGDPASYLTTLQDCLDNDYILKSEYSALYKLTHDSQWMNAEGEHNCLSELLGILRSGEYWEKAHVAGALSRHAYSSDEEATSAFMDMFQVLEQELIALSNPSEASINHTRVVSYIVKSFCQLERKRPTLKNKIQSRLVELLERYIKELYTPNVDISVYFSLQTALSVVLEGILCLSDEKRELHCNLGKYYTIDDPLLAAYSDLNLSDQDILGEKGSSIEDSICNLEERMSAISIAKELLGDSPNGDWYATSRLSLIRINCESWNPFYGFLFAYKRCIYAITCRHNFYSNFSNDFVNVSTASFSLICGSMAPFVGSLQYPEKINSNSSFKNHADDDIAIFKLHQVPACLYKIIFSVNNLMEPVKGTAIHSISIPEGNSINSEKMRSGTIDQLRANGFFYINIPAEKQPVDTRGFSGTAVFGNQAELYGIWKGSDTDVTKCCINSQILLKHLKTIEEGRT